MRPLTRRLIAALPLCLAFSATAHAQERSAAPGQRAADQDDASDAEARDEDARALRRVLLLQNGRALRGIARLRDGAWEHRFADGWTRVDPRLVAGVRLERDVLREARERDPGRGADPVARTDYAGWLVAEGLYEEALQQIDRALEASPHESAALELLHSRRWIALPSLDVPAAELPAAKAELFRRAAGTSRAGRELAIQELERLENKGALQRELLAHMGDGSIRRRAFAAHALGRLFPGAEPERLLTHAVLDSSEDVRRESSFALRASEEPGMIVPLVRALNSQNPRVRTQAAEALGNLGHAAAIAPLMSRLAAAQAQRVGGPRIPHSHIFVGRQFAYVQDFDVEVAQFQAVADPNVNVLIEGSVLEAGVQSNQHYAFAYESKVIRGSLGSLTGENPGYTSRAWLRWWDDNQARFTE